MLRAPLSRVSLSQPCLAAAPLRTKRSNHATRLHHSVPSEAATLQDCATLYQVEQPRRKIAPLRTKWSSHAARLHPSVPSRAATPQDCTTPSQAEQPSSQPALSRLLTSQPCLAAALLRTNRSTHPRNIPIYKQRVRTKRCGPFSFTESEKSHNISSFTPYR